MPLPARPPTRRVEQIQQEAAQVYPRVAEQEEHGNDRCDQVQVPNQTAEHAQQKRDADRAVRLCGFFGLDEIEDGQDLVVGDRGEERGGAGEGLEGGAEGGERDADGDDGGDGPCNSGGKVPKEESCEDL